MARQARSANPDPGLVLAMSGLAAIFFLVVDQVIAFAMRGVFRLG